jgi:magnesium transporter
VAKAARLSIAFIRRNPDSAARVLAATDAADAAAFVDQIPTRYGVEVVMRLNPLVAARIVRGLESATSAALLRDMDLRSASSIFRRLQQADRESLLTQLPTRLQRDLHRSLAFAPGTVGAQMTTAMTTLLARDTVAHAQYLVRQIEQEHVDVIFVVDSDKRLVGAVTGAMLLRHPEQTPLSDIADASCTSVSAYARLESIAGLDAWHDYGTLPVINRRREVIGVIARKALKKMHHAGDAPAGLDDRSLVGSLFATLAMTATGLFNLVGGPASGGTPQGDRSER